MYHFICFFNWIKLILSNLTLTNRLHSCLKKAAVTFINQSTYFELYVAKERLQYLKEQRKICFETKDKHGVLFHLQNIT
jgi:hypothetical protein